MKNPIEIRKNSVDKKRVKGSVLYTVIGVMLIMTLFVMGALALAANANKRAYEDYTRTQTQYTARSVVDSIITTMTQDGNDLGAYASGLSAGAKLDIEVENKTLPNGLGTIDKVTLECVGKDEIGSANYVDGSGKNVIKITATVTLAGKTTTFSEYALNSKILTKKVFPSGGLISYGGIGSTNNPKVYGDAFAIDNKSTDPFSRTNYLSNETVLDGKSYFNSNVVLNSGKKIILGNEEGFTVLGNLGFQNYPQFVSTATTDDYIKLPYISIGGLMNCNNNMFIGTQSKPINIYCGTIRATSNSKTFYSDIYAYDQASAETYTCEGVTCTKGDNILGSDSTNLLNWATSLVTNKNGVAGTYTGGNFYTNGNLTLTDGYKSEADVIVEGNAGLHLNSKDIDINGALYVKGDLTIRFNGEGKTLRVTNGIYCDGTVTIVTNNNNNIKIQSAIIADHITTDGAGRITISNGIFCSNPSLTTGTFNHINLLDSSIKINSIDFNVNEQVYLNLINNVAWGWSGFKPNFKFKISNANYAITFPYVVVGTQSFATQIADIKSNMKKFFPSNMQRMSQPDPADPDYAAKSLLYADNLYKNIVPTPETIAASHNQADGYLDKPDDAASWNTVYTMSTIPSEITSSCTILTKDDGIGRTITVKPNGSADIWINLVGEYSSRMGMTNVIVDNSMNRDASTGKTIRNVNFFVPQNQEITYADPAGGSTITKTTDKTFTFNKVSFVVDKYKTYGDLTIAQSPTDLSVIPNIYIYAGVSDTTESAGTGDETLKFDDSCNVTGYIIANYSKFSWSNIGGGVNSNIFYAKSDGTTEHVGNNVAIVGKVIMGDGSATGNNMTICEIDPTGGIGGGPPSSEVNTWTKFSSGGFARE